MCNTLTLENFNKEDAMNTMAQTHYESTMQMTQVNLREEPSEQYKTYSGKFRNMQKDQDKLLEEDLRLHKFSLHQDLVDKQANHEDLQSDRLQLENLNEKRNFVFKEKITNPNNPNNNLIINKSNSDFKLNLTAVDKIKNNVQSPYRSINN